MVVKNLLNLLGNPAPEVYTALIASWSQVHEVAVAEYTTPPPIQRRARLSAEEQRLIELAAQSRENGRLSYLEILLEMSVKADHTVDGILDAVAYHQRHAENRKWLSKQDVLDGKLISLCESASSGTPLAFLSRVKIDSGAFCHIPLLDLHVEKSHRSLSIVSSIAQKLLNGQYTILETARSYHIVGTHLFSEKERIRFLSKAILFSPITDHAYIAHQLMEFESALRITGRGEQGDVPSLVAVG